MPKASPILSSFNAGQWSPRLEGRVDQQKYFSACRELTNFVPQIHGGAIKRSGTRFVREVKDSADNTRLLPFEFSTAQAYVLEFGDLYMRVYRDNGVVLSAGVPYEVVTPYSASQVSGMQIAQSADVLYVAHPDHPPYKISRTADDSWTVSEIAFDWVPFLSENLDISVTVYASAVTGSGVTLTASSSIFGSDMVDGYFKLREIVGVNHDEWVAGASVPAGSTRRFDGRVYYSTAGGTAGTRPPVHDQGTESDGNITDWEYYHDGEGYLQITGYTSGTVVTATVIKRLPASIVGSANATWRWTEGAWSDKNGYPTTVTFFDDRLLWAGTAANPQTIWGSVVSDYENHRGGTLDDDAYQFTINSDQVNVIQWLSPGKVLLVGTVGGEFVMRASSLEEAITPTNVRVREENSLGGKNIQPVRIGNATLFVQRAGKKVREMLYDFDTDSYRAKDVTLLAENVTSPSIAELSYQKEPGQIVWAVRSDGVLLGLTYERVEDVFGWHVHNIAGTDAKVKSVATIPHPDGDGDQVWLVVERTVNGSTVKYIEYMEKQWERTNSVEDSFFVDSGLTYDGSPATVISGLDHLEGETVTILADGATHPDKTVASGTITLDRSTSVAQIGLSYNATLQTLRVEAGAADGTSQGKTKRINNVTFRFDQTGVGLWYGPDTTTMDELQLRDPSVPMGSAVPIFDGDKGPLVWPAGYEKDGRITIQHRLPLPCTLLAIMPQLTTQDR